MDSDKGKPRKSEGRKATDLKLIVGEGRASFGSYDGRTAEESEKSSCGSAFFLGIVQETFDLA